MGGVRNLQRSKKQHARHVGTVREAFHARAVGLFGLHWGDVRTRHAAAPTTAVVSGSEVNDKKKIAGCARRRANRFGLPWSPEATEPEAMQAGRPSVGSRLFFPDLPA